MSNGKSTTARLGLLQQQQLLQQQLQQSTANAASSGRANHTQKQHSKQYLQQQLLQQQRLNSSHSPSSTTNHSAKIQQQQQQQPGQRQQHQIQTVSKSRLPQRPPQGLFCLYSKRSCHLNRLEGFDFCLKHILEDKNAPYRQCNFVSVTNGRRCLNASPKTDKMKGEGFCFDHARKIKSRWATAAMNVTASGLTAVAPSVGTVSAATASSSATAKAPTSSPSVEEEDPAVTILSRLSDQYLGEPLIPQKRVSIKGPSSSSSLKPSSSTAGDSLLSPPIPKSWSGPESRASKALEMESETDSDGEVAINDAAWRGDAESDAESVDSEQEDQLKTAGVYTAEEVALITREKLIRLQTLYIEQFKRLKHVMQEKRRKLITTKSAEKTKYGSIYGAKTDSKEKRRLERYRAFKRYHKRSGREGLLQQQLNERRTKVSEGAAYVPPSFPKCVAVVEKDNSANDASASTSSATPASPDSVASTSSHGRMCGEKVVPASKFCMRHILMDSQQRLFVACGLSDSAAAVASAAAASNVCATPIPDILPHRPRCPTHNSVEDDEKDEKPFQSLLHLLRAELERRNVKMEPETADDQNAVTATTGSLETGGLPMSQPQSQLLQQHPDQQPQHLHQSKTTSSPVCKEENILKVENKSEDNSQALAETPNSLLSTTTDSFQKPTAPRRQTTTAATGSSAIDVPTSTHSRVSLATSFPSTSVPALNVEKSEAGGADKTDFSHPLPTSAAATKTSPTDAPANKTAIGPSTNIPTAVWSSASVEPKAKKMRMIESEAEFRSGGETLDKDALSCDATLEEGDERMKLNDSLEERKKDDKQLEIHVRNGEFKLEDDDPNRDELNGETKNCSAGRDIDKKNWAISECSGSVKTASVSSKDSTTVTKTVSPTVETNPTTTLLLEEKTIEETKPVIEIREGEAKDGQEDTRPSEKLTTQNTMSKTPCTQNVKEINAPSPFVSSPKESDAVGGKKGVEPEALTDVYPSLSTNAPHLADAGVQLGCSVLAKADPPDTEQSGAVLESSSTVSQLEKNKEIKSATKTNGKPTGSMDDMLTPGTDGQPSARPFTVTDILPTVDTSVKPIQLAASADNQSAASTNDNPSAQIAKSEETPQPPDVESASDAESDAQPAMDNGTQTTLLSLSFQSSHEDESFDLDESNADEEGSTEDETKIGNKEMIEENGKGEKV